MDSPAPRNSSDIQDLVAEALDRFEQEGPAALEQLYAEHPESADALRERIDWLIETGLAEPPRDAPSEYPEQLGDFRLIEPIGQGGMGVVYRAEQLSLGREVALKLVRPEHLFFPGARDRFEREVTTIAGLAHPGIVPIYAVGEAQGIPYFAMERIGGASLGQVIGELTGKDVSTLTGADLSAALSAALGEAGGEKGHETDCEAGREGDRPTPQLLEGPWPTVCARLIREVAEALEHAHRRGVLHRDVKPSNVMLTQGGRVMLLDFGLSSSESSEDRRTKTGQQVGTLAYMAPEQLRGERELTARTDVYGLGIVLYELLALRLPFGAGSPTERLERADQAVPADLRKLDPRISWELETVVQTATDPDPVRRYASAAEFGRDLGNVLANRPISARRSSPILRARRWIQRHPAAALGVAVAVVAPTAFAVRESQSNRALTAKGAELEAKGRELAATNDALREALAEAEWQQAEAERQKTVADGARERSERNFERAYESVELMLGRVGGEILKDVPRMGNLRAQLLGDALRLQEELLADFEAQGANADEGADPKARELYARTLRRAATLRGELGHIDRTLETLDELEALIVAMAAEAPSLDLEIRRAQLDLQRAQAHRGARRLPEAEAAARAGLTRLAGVENQDPPRIALVRAQITTHLAESLNIVGRSAEARERLEPAVDDLRELVERDLEARDRRLYLARALEVLAGMPESTVVGQVDNFDPRAATPLLEEAAELWQELADEAPDDSNALQNLAKTSLALGTARAGLGDLVGSEEDVVLALETFERLRDEFPSKPYYLEGLGSACLNLGSLTAQRNAMDEHERYCGLAVDAFETLTREHPEYAGAKRKLVLALGQHARALLNVDPASARGHAEMKRMQAMALPLIGTDPDPTLRFFYMWSCAAVAGSWARAGDAQGTVEAARCYLELDATPVELAYAAQYIATGVGLGREQELDEDRLFEWAHEALDLLDRAAGNSPRDPALHKELIDPALDPIADEERYRALLDLVGITPRR